MILHLIYFWGILLCQQAVLLTANCLASNYTCNVSWSSCLRGSLRDPNEVSRVDGVVLGEKGHLLDQKQTVKGYGLRSHIVSTYGIYIFFILYFELKKNNYRYYVYHYRYYLIIYFYLFILFLIQF